MIPRMLFAAIALTAVAVCSSVQARWLSAESGLFITRAPLPTPLEHPYGYAGANPVNEVDPRGRDFSPAWSPGHGRATVITPTPFQRVCFCALGDTPTSPHGHLEARPICITTGPASMPTGGGTLHYGYAQFMDPNFDLDHICVRGRAIKFRTGGPGIGPDPLGDGYRVRGGYHNPQDDWVCRSCPMCFNYDDLSHPDMDQPLGPIPGSM
jgi:hypothetical protein